MLASEQILGAIKLSKEAKKLLNFSSNRRHIEEILSFVFTTLIDHTYAKCAQLQLVTGTPVFRFVACPRLLNLVPHVREADRLILLRDVCSPYPFQIQTHAHT